MKLLYLVTLGPVQEQWRHTFTRQVVCTFDSDINDRQMSQINEALECANLNLVTKETHEKEQ